MRVGFLFWVTPSIYELSHSLSPSHVHDRTEKRVDCKYLPLSHTKPQKTFLRLCMEQREVLTVHALSVLSWTTPTKPQDLLDHIQLIMRLNSQHIKGYYQKRQVTYSEINTVLLLKTPGGSSFIWLLPNSLRKHIP